MEKVIGNYTSQENRSFPLDCETLEAIQNNIDMLGALGNMVGDKTILSGCQPKGSGGRTDGYIFLKTIAYPMGEVLHFAGSNENSDYLHLVTTNGNVTQGDVTYNAAYTTRQIVQGTGAEQWPWAELKEPVDIDAIAASLSKQMGDLQAEVAKIKPVPLGVVEMYSGSVIPDNYAVCDGQALSQTLYPDLYAVLGTRFNKAGTATGMFCLPDLRGRFVVGQGSDADYNTIGNTGGEKAHRLTESQMPKHKHKFFGDDMLKNHLSKWGGTLVESASGYDADSSGSGNSNVYTTSETGGGEAHENRPPYFVLFYIMRLK